MLTTAAPLPDITGHWAEDDVRELVGMGAITGYPDGTYRPQHTITRAEFSSVLRGALGLPEVPGHTFADTAGHWGAGRIEALIAAGVIDTMMYGEAYVPDGAITREEIAMMTVRMLGPLTGASSIPFADADQVGVGYHAYVAEAFARQIVTGYPDGTFRPAGTATRAEAAVMATRTLRILAVQTPQATMYADLTALPFGGSTDLHWDVEGATEVTIQPDIGAVTSAGSTAISPLFSTTYVLTASNQAGSTEVAVEVSVAPMVVIPLPKPGVIIRAPAVNYFSSDKSLMSQGLSATLSWDVSGPAKVTIQPGIGEVGLSGTANVKPLTRTTYTLTASNSSGEVTATVTIAMAAEWKMQGLGHGVKDHCWSWTRSGYNSPSDRLWVGSRTVPVGQFRSGLWFDVHPGMPEGAIVTRAGLHLYQYETWADHGPFMIGVHTASEAWEVGQWSLPKLALVPDSTAVVNPGSRWVHWDVTAMVQRWLDGDIPNHGMVLTLASHITNVARFYRSNYTAHPPLRPYLIIEYYVP